MSKSSSILQICTNPLQLRNITTVLKVLAVDDLTYDIVAPLVEHKMLYERL